MLRRNSDAFQPLPQRMPRYCSVPAVDSADDMHMHKSSPSVAEVIPQNAVCHCAFRSMECRTPTRLPSTGRPHTSGAHVQCHAKCASVWNVVHIGSVLLRRAQRSCPVFHTRVPSTRPTTSPTKLAVQTSALRSRASLLMSRTRPWALLSRSFAGASLTVVLCPACTLGTIAS